MKKMSIYLSLFLVLSVFSAFSWAQVKPDTKPYGGLLWKAERENWTLYLYGVSHSAETVLEINSQVKKLIESSNIYVSELPLGKVVEHPIDVKDIRREFLDKPYVLNSQAETAFRKMHLDGVIGAYQYWALRHQHQITGTQALYAELVFRQHANNKIFATDFPKSRPGPDRIVLNLAHSKKIATVQIEPEHTAHRYWLKNCDNENDNSASLLSLIDIATNHTAKATRLHQAIADGDLAKFQNAVDSGIDLDFLRLDYQCHVIDRNKFWVDRLNRLTSHRETSLRPEKSIMFFTFGAMHAITPKKFPGTSLIDLLKQQDWKITWMDSTP